MTTAPAVIFHAANLPEQGGCPPQLDNDTGRHGSSDQSEAAGLFYSEGQ